MKIAQVLSSVAWGEIGPDKLQEGIGGREGALLRLSKEWAKQGHEVTNYVTGKSATRFHEGGKIYDPELELEFDERGWHEYVPSQLAKICLATFEYDAVVAWECPSVYSDPRIVDKQRIRLVEMQCAHLPSNSEMDDAENYATGVCTLSSWHRDFMLHYGLGVDRERMHVLPNCIDLDAYPEQIPGAKFEFGKSPRFFYSSSPDRGLWHLLELWPQVRSRYRNATLYVAYGVKDWVSQAVWNHSRLGEMALKIAELLNQPGVIDLGKIGQDELAKIQQQCTAWLYPLDSIQPTETGCITAIEAMAAYCPVITTDCDCMAEEFGDVAAIVELPFDSANFLEAIDAVLGDEQMYTEMATLGRKFAESRQWKDVAGEWIALFHSQTSPS